MLGQAPQLLVLFYKLKLDNLLTYKSVNNYYDMHKHKDTKIACER